MFAWRYLNRNIQMKTSFPLLTSVCLALFCLLKASAQETTRTNSIHQWSHDRPYGRPFDGSQLKQCPRIRVQGNKFVDPEGKTVLFRGVSIADPDRLEHA